MRIYLIIFLTLSATVALGQDNFKRKSLFFELGGNGVYGSVNYERQLTPKPGFSARIGLGTLYGSRVGPYAQSAYWLTIPVGFNYLINLKNHRSFIDAGLGATWTPLELYFKLPKHPDRKSFINFVPSIGYRRHTKRNVMWRINLTPLIYRDVVIPWAHWAGVSVGKRF